ncbi:MAG: S1 RNA-binding domain-containing protein [Planctomycetota bacterium]|nr:S1 RNA-binding domain-containing protein [Planctomycetota bacterium]
MKDLPAIARYMRLPEEQLRFPVELFHQGFEPNYLATYRPDELGGLDGKTLARLKRSVVYESALSNHKDQIAEGLQKEGHFNDEVADVLVQCTSISQVDAIAKNLRGKKTAKAFADSDLNIEKVGQAILLYRGDNIQDFQAWVQAQTGLEPQEAELLVPKVKRWLQLLLSEDAQLMLALQRALLKNAVVNVKVLPEPSQNPNQPSLDLPPQENPETQASGQPHEPQSQSPAALDPLLSATAAPTPVDTAPVDTAPANIESRETSEAPASEAPDAAAAPGTPTEPSEAIASFKNDRKKPREIRTKSLSDKQLSPRQRRRRWLRGILESYSKLRKPIRDLTPFQVLMLSRGLRSQIIQLQFQIDTKYLVQLCRDSLCPDRHPMHPLLMEVADTGLKEFLLPRLQQDVLAILEEDANQALIESAVEHLETVMLQRPVRGHRVLMIDAVGQKTAAVSIVDAQGTLLMTGDIVCNSSKSDVVSQNVAQLGQWVHEHQVTLVALTNGHARRYLVHSVAELMKQSAEGSLFWTFADRQGADAFCTSRNSLVELPKISRRHRAAVWLAWKLQDPLRQILKIEPARLRLGSYQRELPQAELEAALQEAISSAITKAGVDMYHADLEVLKRIPGMDDATAKRVVEERPKGSLSDRESLGKLLKESLSESRARQAIGFLRVYQSNNPLDGTIIHPEDYRLAERLVEHAQLPAPASTPDGWSKPDYEKIAAAIAAAQSMALDAPSSELVEAFGFDSHADEINPNFGIIESPADASENPIAPENIQTPEIQTAKESQETPVAEETSAASETTQDKTTQDKTTQDPESSESPAPSEPAPSEPAPSEPAPSEPVLAVTRAPISMPEIPESPMQRPALAIDADKLARSWQVGRSKLLSVSRALQFPFADGREFQYPVPLRSYVPTMERLEPGSMLSALVIGIANFGVFVELGPDCTGLIHISQLGPSFIEDAHQFVQVGDVIPVWVLHTDDKKKRVALTTRAPGSEPESNHRDADNQRPQNDSKNRSDRQGSPQDRRDPGRPNSAGSPSGSRGDRPNSTRPDNRGARPSGDSRGSYRKPDANRRSNSGQGYSENGEGRSNRQVKISRPVPEKPITEAMQQGKEPLRSFGDLMQYLKKGPTTPETPAPSSSTADAVPSTDAPNGSPEGATTPSPGTDDV